MPNVNVLKYKKGIYHTFHASYASNWGNPFDSDHNDEVKTVEEATERFRTWLSGETDTDFRQQRRIWLLNYIGCWEGKTVMAEHPEYVEVLVEMMTPDFDFPEFKLSDLIEDDKPKKKDPAPKLKMKPLF